VVDMDGLQVKIRDWGVAVFGTAHMKDKKIRALRLVEEAIEYCQSCGLSEPDIVKVVSHVFSRPCNKHPLDELGGVLLTAVAAADTHHAWARGLLECEVNRVLTKSAESLQASEERKRNASLIP
jgi:hypothetical protein